MRRSLFFCSTVGKEALIGEGGGEGKIKALSRDARQVLVCTSFFREIWGSAGSRIASRVEAAIWQSTEHILSALGTTGSAAMYWRPCLIAKASKHS